MRLGREEVDKRILRPGEQGGGRGEGRTYSRFSMVSTAQNLKKPFRFIVACIAAKGHLKRMFEAPHPISLEAS
jgi:hypothetical protein